MAADWPDVRMFQGVEEGFKRAHDSAVGPAARDITVARRRADIVKPLGINVDWDAQRVAPSWCRPHPRWQRLSRT
jgi:hypothetical protein